MGFLSLVRVGEVCILDRQIRLIAKTYQSGSCVRCGLVRGLTRSQLIQKATSLMRCLD